jgi:two-component system response regulator HydG
VERFDGLHFSFIKMKYRPFLSKGDPMRVEEMSHQGLLQIDPEGGTILFAGQRALLLDAVSMGLLRKYLVENFGLTAARTILTQFGFAHGWRMAEALQSEFHWDSEEDWLRAGTRVSILCGLFRAEPSSHGPLGKEGLALTASYEAEQHLLHFGHSDTPICWTICGLTSGYLSRILNKEIYVLEDRCLSKGDVACHLFARTRREWGEERGEELIFFEPLRLKECLDVSLQRVTETLKSAERKLQEHRSALGRITRGSETSSGLISKSPVMERLSEMARRIALVDSTVLIIGESGVGKERVAQLVHDESMRSKGPFIAVNCGAITETLLESELFGHSKGSFTGANSDRPGLFEASSGGTILLDEIGDVSPAMQLKLLRVLQEREIRRVGENKSRKVDVRIIAATNCDLTQMIAKGSFRQDLYYRLKVVVLHVPPLRERREDILPLARVLLAEAAIRMKRKLVGISSLAADHLLRYEWPGNVRELENAMEHAVALAVGPRLELEDLPDEVRQTFLKTPTLSGEVRPLAEIERDYILAALLHNEGNHANTAKQLQIGSATLYRKLKQYTPEKPEAEISNKP